MIVYCDTSFFVRQLVPGEDRADAMRASREIVQKSGAVPLTKLTRFEVIQALRFEIWRNRKDRNQGLPSTQAEAALNLFLAEIGSLFHLTELDLDVTLKRAELLTRSTPDKGWRTIDLLHVASATCLNAVDFFSFDEQQNELARGEGLRTPLSHVS